MKLSEIKYSGQKINALTKNGEYVLINHYYNKNNDSIKLYTGTFKACWIKREYLAQHEKIDNFEIMLLSEWE